jgi:hypothetical protein
MSKHSTKERAGRRTSFALSLVVSVAKAFGSHWVSARKPLLPGVVLLGLLGALTVAVGPAGATLQLLKPSAADSSTFSGHGGYSADGLGQDGTGGTIQADVPAGSTVVQAYLYGTYFSADPAMDVSERTITLDSTDVVMDVLPNSEPGPCCQLLTTRATVTTQVAAKVGSGGGITDFVVNSDPATLDGVALVVLYSNPTLPAVTIAVLDGGSKQEGDQVTLNFASPLDLANPGFSATLSLGSGFSYQGTDGHDCGDTQFSTVDVDGARLTSCAGNWDDGYSSDGGLITVGGVGDSTDNPTDPNAMDIGTDDELYNLVPFLHTGDTSMTLQTTNPSGDDNLFLAVIEITAQAAVTTEVCNDGIDNDGDGLIDAADPDCAPPVADATSTTYGGGTTVQYSDPLPVSGTLLDTSTANSPVAGKTLGFTLGSGVTAQSTSGTTSATGIASGSITVNQVPSAVPYDLATSFAGDASFAASSDTDAVTVTKETCVLTQPISLQSSATGTTTLTANFGENDTSFGDRAGKTVTFAVSDGTTTTNYTGTTAANGDVSVTVALGAGVYSYTVSFAGDTYYTACATPGGGDTIVTVAPAGFKVTGGGWIVLNGVGHTSFGFNAVSDVTGLHGQIEVRSNKSRFHGTTVLTLNGSGNNATWTGTGKWNGVAGYTFAVSVVDNGSGGAKKGDTITIVIKDSHGNTVLTTVGAQTLKGGNITVH